MNRSDILERIKFERERQLDLPGSELDANNTVNDWVAIAGYYLSQEARRATTNQTRQSDLENELIKAAAVIVAALEHTDIMKKRETFRNGV